MERLSFAEEGSYIGIEAAIHIARYALARDACRGRKVLDLACGEGYGSRLMLDWGATEVVGVDVSEEAVTSARERFGCDGLRYLRGDAEKVEALLAGEHFDLIISLETIEHLHNPVAYLEALTGLRAPDGEILISCPNDWWYYPSAEQSNPYHIRKYAYEEFLALVTPVLGEPDAIALGFPVTGFINVSMKDISPVNAHLTQIAMMSSRESRNALVVPIEPGSVAPGNSSYFVARWGCVDATSAGAGILPVSMDIFRNGMYSSKQAQQTATALAEQAQQAATALAEQAQQAAVALAEQEERAAAALAEREEQVAAALVKQADLQSDLDALSRDLVARNREVADLKLKLQSSGVCQAALLVENNVIRSNVDLLTSEKARLEKELESMNGRQAELLSENNGLTSEKAQLESELKVASIAAHRYFRLRAMIPAFVLSLGRRLRTLVRVGK